MRISRTSVAENALFVVASLSIIGLASPVLGQNEPVLAQPALGTSDLETVSFDSFSEPVELGVLVNYIGGYLNWNLELKTALTGSVSFNTQREVRIEDLDVLLQALLDQHDYALTYNPETDFYIIMQASEVGLNFDGPLATTKLISTPNMRPSALQSTLDSALGGAGTIAYLDELGSILVTAPPMRIKRVEQLLEQLIGKRGELEYVRIELQHVAAPDARQRAIDLVAPSSGGTLSIAQQQARQQQGRQANPGLGIGGQGGGFDNLESRLSVSTHGNALIFRGRTDEIALVQEVILLIDQPSTLEPRKYFAGSGAQAIAQIASDRGLGEVIVLADRRQTNLVARQQADPSGRNPFSQDSSAGGGPAMIVDVQRGSITYYATTAQHELMERIVDELDADDERIVTRQYKLHHASAEDTADLINQLLDSGTNNRSAPLLPGQAGQQAQAPVIAPQQTEDGELSLAGARNVRVVADASTNQLFISAPVKQHEEFAKLIEKLDLRRPQVYIEATIVAVSNSEDFRLAIETQIINNGGFARTTQSNFGLSTAGDTFATPRSVASELIGLTSAVILSRDVPAILHAVQTDTDARIISVPQLLVDDNEEAEIVSVDQQPTTTVSQGTSTTSTSFGGFQDAGTTLTVTPRISEGGYLQLAYQIELSNFTGQGANGVPAPRQQRNIRSDSVTIPSDSTIIVGGITLEETRDTVVKIPLLGDIPWVGALFRDTRQVTNDATLYVFITPRIMRDDNSRDLRLLSMGPQHRMGIARLVPDMQPTIIRVNDASFSMASLDPSLTRSSSMPETMPTAPQGTEPRPEPIPLIDLPDAAIDPKDDPTYDPGLIRRRKEQ